MKNATSSNRISFNLNCLSRIPTCSSFLQKILPTKHNKALFQYFSSIYFSWAICLSILFFPSSIPSSSTPSDPHQITHDFIFLIPVHLDPFVKGNPWEGRVNNKWQHLIPLGTGSKITVGSKPPGYRETW